MKRLAIERAAWLAVAWSAACGAHTGEPGSGGARSAGDTPLVAPTVSASGSAPQSPSDSAATAVPSSRAATAAAPASAGPPEPAQPAVPPPRPAAIALASSAHDTRLAAGDAAYQRRDWAAAQAQYEAELAANPRSVPALVGIARVRIARLDLPTDYGSAKGDGAKKGNPQVLAASADLLALTKRAPAFGPAFVELGRARLLLGDAPGALDALQRGTALLGDEPEAHSQLGIAFLATGRADEAVRELGRAAELDPGSPARHGNYGTALLMLGRTKEAIAEYEARVRLDDGDARAHSDLGTALLGTQDLERAVRELQRAIQIEPDRASFHSNLGFAFEQSGRIDLAVPEYREALRRDAKLVSAWINLATALARNPRTRAEARSALDRAAALSPGDPRVKANLEELDALDAPDAGAPRGH
jgi:tetratricopeptide (TPR) repeat protein